MRVKTLRFLRERFRPLISRQDVTEDVSFWQHGSVQGIRNESLKQRRAGPLRTSNEDQFHRLPDRDN